MKLIIILIVLNILFSANHLKNKKNLENTKSEIIHLIKI